MNKICTRCFSECAGEAYTCHSCGFHFSKSKRIWNRVINIASVLSLFVGLLVVIVNQSTQILDRIKPTKFIALGMQTAQGTNRLITDNYALAIDSGTGILLDKLTFSSKGEITNNLGVSFMHGKAYKASDVAIIRIDPTAIHYSYKPVPIEAINAVLENGIQPSQISDLFKVRPTHAGNSLYSKYPWAVLSGEVKIDYFEPQRNSSERLSEVYKSELMLWGRKEDSMKKRLKNDRYNGVDVDDLIQKYTEIINLYRK